MKKIKLAFFAITMISFLEFAKSIDTEITGFRIASSEAKKITAHNVCMNISNNKDEAIFVPTKTANEWTMFLTGLPINVTATECCPSQTFNYTGGEQSISVPSGCTQAMITAYGAQGGNGSFSSGGLGGQATGVINVTSGEILYVFVGGSGSWAGGFNGGGNSSDVYYSGGGGGGASDVRQGGNTPEKRVIVAGGGGGGGGPKYSSPPFGGGGGGSGGGLNGGGGGNGATSCAGGGYPGGGGSQTAGGGSGVTGPCCGGAGAPGTFGNGGGGSRGSYGNHGGGGGGGYFGGGGGSSGYEGCSAVYPGSGGGGGSSYVSGTNTSTTGGIRASNGMVIIDFRWEGEL